MLLVPDCSVRALPLPVALVRSANKHAKNSHHIDILRVILTKAASILPTCTRSAAIAIGRTVRPRLPLMGRSMGHTPSSLWRERGRKASW